MAGGDLLYIFAFIILPAAVLVSCIWALILLRRGALLPERPVRQYAERDTEQADGEELDPDLVEETGEHIAIEPARRPEPAVVAHVAAAPVAGEEPVAVPAGAKAEDVPVVERTQEMSAVPVEPPAEDIAPVDEPSVEPIESVKAEDAPAVAAQAAADDDVLIVPLEESMPRYANGRTEPATAAEAAVQAADEVEPVTSATERRQARRPVRLRPGEADLARPRPRIGQRRTARRDGG